MKLTSIALRNFRAAVNVTLNTDAPRVLVSGVNGAGKSSIRDVVRWVLRGCCVGTDAKGTGWESLIPSGTTTLAGGLTVAGIGSVERVYRNGTRSLLVEDVTGEPSVQQQALYLKLDTTPAYLDAVLDTGAFLQLHHAEAKALVLALLDVRIPVGEESLTLDQLDARYKVAFQERTGVKARAKALPVLVKPAAEPMPTVAAIEEQLGRIRAELQTLTAGAGSSAGKREILERELREAQQLEPLPQVDEALIADLEERIAIMEADLDERQQEPVSAPPVLPGAFGQGHADTPRVIQLLTTHKPKGGCVLESGVPCETAKVKFTLRARALQAELEASGVAPQAAPPVTRPVGPTALQTARKALGEAKQGQANYLAAAERNAVKKAAQVALAAQIAVLPASVDSQAEIATLQARIGKGELLLGRARLHWQAVDAYQKALQQEKAVLAEVDRLEALCETLGPNGARAAALAAAVGGFEAAINAFTGAFGWTVAFEIEPWAVRANDRLVETYSESEQFRIGIALQLAIAQLSGLSFAIVDRLDMLDVHNRALVTRMLIEAPLEQIVILATREPGQALPTMEGVIAYRLASEAGRTVIVEQTGV